MSKITEYVKASIAEMKKVTWPTRRETYNYAVLVIGVSIAMAMFLGGLDYIFSLGLQIFVRQTGGG